MKEVVRLTGEDLLSFQVNREEAIEFIKHYAPQYKSKEHYEELGASCVMSATGTINTVIGSAQYLDGVFIMPDTIDVEKLVIWFMQNRDSDCDYSILTFYIAHFIKRKINEMYKAINKYILPSTTIILMGNARARKEFRKQVADRSKVGVK